MGSIISMRLHMEPVRSLSYTSVTSAYLAIGSAFAYPVRLLFVQNLTDVTLMFSLDGYNDNFPLPTNGFLLIDVTTNKAQTSGFFIAEGTQVYVKEIGTPSTGSVYVSTVYGYDSYQ